MRKRIFDIVVSAILLVVLAPLFLLIAIAIRRTSEGPAIFRQVRLGRHQKPFVILKFRTMYQGSGGLPQDRVTKGDPRVTPIGKLLRPTFMDELPQLWNVLRGDMSLVGPRPYRGPKEEIRAKVRDYDKRYSVRPGMAGLAQLRGRPSTDPRRKASIRRDIIYAKNACLFLDIRILIATLPLILHRQGI